jgi:hypothetical protein
MAGNFACHRKGIAILPEPNIQVANIEMIAPAEHEPPRCRKRFASVVNLLLIEPTQAKPHTNDLMRM